MLSLNDPENARLRPYDYVAIPKFLHVDSLEGKAKYGFAIDLQVEFYAINGSSITIKGHGDSMIGGSLPANAGTYPVISRPDG